MAWYFRVIEHETAPGRAATAAACSTSTGRWQTPSTTSKALAAAHPPAEVMVHWLDGSVQNLGAAT
jgi:hypothetical protein